ncbi:hypothetical protein FRC14_004315 [Serendipita sp. 396]|nr:hypothetical protein FRC14_004315 [Serendipita sp. 396]KAG8781797.1 hypothetical protein FRC15_008084 [Serendipita sp. 397]KAG8821868.1 hypothetical protein FRC19_007103 [Serendipita sp. 401]KAG8866465.1 hypothetical protein FRC20_008468 [Serendipita sp. 405]KAG9053939.1 hypothetical protein FS842_006701 [Serendipita sp. 407]
MNDTFGPIYDSVNPLSVWPVEGSFASDPCRFPHTASIFYSGRATSTDYNNYNKGDGIVHNEQVDGSLPIWTVSNKSSGWPIDRRNNSQPLVSIRPGYYNNPGNEPTLARPHLGPSASEGAWAEPQPWNPNALGVDNFFLEGLSSLEYDMEPGCISTLGLQPASDPLDGRHPSESLGEIGSPDSGTEDGSNCGRRSTSPSQMSPMGNSNMLSPAAGPDKNYLYQQHLLSFATADWVVRNGPEPRDGCGQSLLMGFLSVSDNHGRNSGKKGKSQHQKGIIWESRRERENGLVQKKQSTYICQFRDCGKKLERKDRALSHVRMHLGYRPFVCSGACGVGGW